MMVVVQRPFSGPDGPLTQNELVDATGWKNLTLLINNRFVRPASTVEIDSAIPVDVGPSESESTPKKTSKRNSRAQSK